MSYIAYFDLLGTRGFCENREIYYDNIQRFYQAIHQESCFLRGCGQVGVFSDCAYAESSDLNSLLDFLTEVRDRLLSQGLFFNAVVKEGTLSIDYVNVTESKPAFGIVFNDPAIADLYITQTYFKGIGISVSPSLVDEINNNTNYATTDCIYIDQIDRNGNKYFTPKAYKDIKFKYDGYQKELNHTLNIFYHEFYSAYVKSPRFGRYYISALSNFLRSCTEKLKWNYEKKDFDSPVPLILKTIENILDKYNEDLSDLSGVEFLALVMLDEVYNSKEITEEDKRNYTKKIISIDCVKTKFIHSLNEIPQCIFTNDKKNNINNRDLFIRYCQEDMSDGFVEKLLVR